MNRPEETSLDGGGVQNNGIFLVVPGVTRNSDNTVDPRWQLSKPEVLHRPGGDQRFVGVVQDVRQSVHPYVKVCDVDPHSLFTHSALNKTIRTNGKLKA
jgi:hypothetical protein